MADGTEDEGGRDEGGPWRAILREHADWIEAGHPRSPFPMFGFEVGPGWAGLLGKLFDDVARIVRPTGRRVVIGQIKEKFGTLRFYWSGPFDRETSDRIDEAVDLAEFRSACTCEECGARGSLRVARGWYAVRCDEHASEGSRRFPAASGISAATTAGASSGRSTTTRHRHGHPNPADQGRIRRTHEEKTR